MTQYGFYFDSSRCTGCKTCELTCKDYNDLGTEILFRRIYDVEGGTWNVTADDIFSHDAFVYHVSVACNHCDAPACVGACPTGSMVKHDEAGLVYNDPDACIACGSCVEACPYDAPRIDTGFNVSRKCDGCHQRVEAGGIPICVQACPMRALEFGPIDELRASYGALADVNPLPDSSQTAPNLCLRLGAVDADRAATGQVANPLEVA